MTCPGICKPADYVTSIIADVAAITGDLLGWRLLAFSRPAAHGKPRNSRNSRKSGVADIAKVPLITAAYGPCAGSPDSGACNTRASRSATACATGLGVSGIPRAVREVHSWHSRACPGEPAPQRTADSTRVSTPLCLTPSCTCAPAGRQPGHREHYGQRNGDEPDCQYLQSRRGGRGIRGRADAAFGCPRTGFRGRARYGGGADARG